LLATKKRARMLTSDVSRFLCIPPFSPRQPRLPALTRGLQNGASLREATRRIPPSAAPPSTAPKPPSAESRRAPRRNRRAPNPAERRTRERLSEGERLSERRTRERLGAKGSERKALGAGKAFGGGRGSRRGRGSRSAEPGKGLSGGRLPEGRLLGAGWNCAPCRGRGRVGSSLFASETGARVRPQFDRWVWVQGT
jgi:hypothetical protein